MAYTRHLGQLTQEGATLALEQGGQAAYAASSALAIDGIGEAKGADSVLLPPPAAATTLLQYVPWALLGVAAAYLWGKR